MFNTCKRMDKSSVRGISQASILEWVAISLARGSSWPRDWTQVSWIVGRFFSNCATKGLFSASHCFRVISLKKCVSEYFTQCPMTYEVSLLWLGKGKLFTSILQKFFGLLLSSGTFWSLAEFDFKFVENST